MSTKLQKGNLVEVNGKEYWICDCYEFPFCEITKPACVWCGEICPTPVTADICHVCGGDGIQSSGVRGARKCIACDGTGKCQ